MDTNLDKIIGEGETAVSIDLDAKSFDVDIDYEGDILYYQWTLENSITENNDDVSEIILALEGEALETIENLQLPIGYYQISVTVEDILGEEPASRIIEVRVGNPSIDLLQSYRFIKTDDCNIISLIYSESDFVGITKNNDRIYIDIPSDKDGFIFNYNDINDLSEFSYGSDKLIYISGESSSARLAFKADLVNLNGYFPSGLEIEINNIPVFYMSEYNDFSLELYTSITPPFEERIESTIELIRVGKPALNMYDDYILTTNDIVFFNNYIEIDTILYTESSVTGIASDEIKITASGIDWNIDDIIIESSLESTPTVSLDESNIDTLRIDIPLSLNGLQSEDWIKIYNARLVYDNILSPTNLIYNVNKLCLDDGVTENHILIGTPTIEFSEPGTKIFVRADSIVVLNEIIISQSGASTITQNIGIKIEIPETSDNLFHEIQESISFSGTGSGKIDLNDSYEILDEGKTCLIKINENFILSDILKITGLQLNLQAIDEFNLNLSVNDVGVEDATMTHSIKVGNPTFQSTNQSFLASQIDNPNIIELAPIIVAENGYATITDSVIFNLYNMGNAVWSDSDIICLGDDCPQLDFLGFGSDELIIKFSNMSAWSNVSEIILSGIKIRTDTNESNASIRARVDSSMPGKYMQVKNESSTDATTFQSIRPNLSIDDSLLIVNDQNIYLSDFNLNLNFNLEESETLNISFLDISTYCTDIVNEVSCKSDDFNCLWADGACIAEDLLEISFDDYINCSGCSCSVKENSIRIDEYTTGCNISSLDVLVNINNIESDSVKAVVYLNKVSNNQNYYYTSSGTLKISKPGFSTVNNEQNLLGMNHDYLVNDFLIEDSGILPIIDNKRELLIKSPNPLEWNTDITYLNITGTGSGKISPIVEYDDNLLIIKIIGTFSESESIILSGMRVNNPLNLNCEDNNSFSLSIPLKPLIPSQHFFTEHLVDSASISCNSVIFTYDDEVGGIEDVILLKGDDSQVDINFSFDGEITLPLFILLPNNLPIEFKDKFQQSTLNDVNVECGENYCKLTNNDFLYSGGIIEFNEAFTLINNSNFESSTDSGYVEYISAGSIDEAIGNSNSYINYNNILKLIGPSLAMSETATMVAGIQTDIKFPDLILTEAYSLSPNIEYEISIQVQAENGYSRYTDYNFEVKDDSNCSEIVGLDHCIVNDEGKYKFKVGSELSFSDTIIFSDIIFSEINLDQGEIYKFVIINEDLDPIARTDINFIAVSSEVTIQQDMANIFWVDLNPKTLGSITICQDELYTFKYDSLKLSFEYDSNLLWDETGKSTLTIDATEFESCQELGANKIVFNPKIFENGNTNSCIEVVSIETELIDGLNTFKLESVSEFEIRYSPMIDISSTLTMNCKNTNGDIDECNPSMPISPETFDSFKLAIVVNEGSLFGKKIDSLKGLLKLESNTDILEIDLSYPTQIADVVISNDLIPMKKLTYTLTDSTIQIINNINEKNQDSELYISLKLDQVDCELNRLDGDASKSAKISLGWAAADNFNISITSNNSNVNERFINPDSTGIIFELSDIYLPEIYFTFYNSIEDIWFNPIPKISSNDSTINLSTEDLKSLDLISGLYYLYIYSLNENGSFTFPFTKKIIIDKQKPILVSLTPTTLLSETRIDQFSESKSIHSISDGENFYLSITDYPVGANSDSIFTFINDISIDVSENDGKKIFNNIDVNVLFTINEEPIIEEIKVLSIITNNPNNYLYTFEMPIIITDSSKVILDIDYTISDKASNSVSYFARYHYYPSSNNYDNHLISEIFNYPNPFSSYSGEGTNIRYTLANDASNKKGKYIVFNSNGELIWYYTLKASDLSLGTHSVYWDGKMQNNHFLSNGIYFGFLEIGNKIIKHKIVVMNNE